jgi:hypothetical protein
MTTQPTLVPQPTKRPTNKLTAAGIAGALTTIIVSAAALFDVEIDAPLAAAITTVLSVAAGYVVKDRRNT